MDIKDFLSPDHVTLDVRAPDKVRLLQDLCRRAAEALGLDTGPVADAVLRREELGSTGTGDGIAIPHARMAEVNKPFGVLARLRKGIDYASIDGKPVDLVFLLLLPQSAAGEQLNALASVARKLRNAETTTALRRAREPRDVYRTIADG